MILVTGASGKTGGALARVLLAEGISVRAIVHARDERSEQLKHLGAEVVVADIFDTDSLRRAMQGTRRAYYVPPIHPYAIQSAVAFADAARSARLEAIVQMGQWLSHADHPSIMTRQTRMMDRLLAELPGVAHTVLNPGMFADNFLRVIDFASLLGVFPYLTGDGKAAPVSNEDMARVAAAVLRDPERHAGKTYRPTGPQLLSGVEMAAAIARVLGRSVRPVPIPFWLFSKVARSQHIDPIQVSGFRYYIEDMKRGAFAFAGGITQTVEALTGSPAESFETTACRYAAMQFAQPTAANRARAIASFLRMPFMPGYDLPRLDRSWGFPMPAEPTLSIESEEWRTDHERIMAEQPVRGALA